MANTDCLQPSLTPDEKAVVQAYGGWTRFMQSMGLKPWEEEDAQEGKQIAAVFAADKDEDAKSEAGDGGAGSSDSKPKAK